MIRNIHIQLFIPMDDVYHGYYNTWYPVSEPFKWDFSFLRFPLLIKYKTPTRLQLSFGVGVFYSVLLNDKLTKDERNTAEKDNRNIYPRHARLGAISFRPIFPTRLPIT